MFYVWLFTSVIFFLSIVGQLFSLSLGFLPNISNLFLTIALQITTISLAIKKYREPHKANYSMLAISLWLIVFCMFMLLAFNMKNYLGSIRIAEIALFLLSIGAVIFFYNKRGLTEEEFEIQETTDFKEEYEDLIYETIFTIEKVLSIEGNQTEFSIDLINCEEILNFVLNREYMIKTILLSETIQLLENYYYLKSTLLQTEENIEIQNKIQSTFGKLNEAFIQVIKENDQKFLDEIEINTDILNKQLDK